MKTPAIITKFLTEYFRWLAGSVAILVLIVGYLLIVAPKISEVQTSQVSAQKNAAADLQAKQAYIAALKQSNEKFAAALPADRRAVINGFMPSTADFPGLLLTVKNIVTQSQLTLDSIAIGQGGQVAVAAGAAAGSGVKAGTTPATAQAATVSGVNVKTQDISITVSGGTSYDAFKTFLANIESSRRLFDVVSVNFTSSTKTTTGTTGGTSGSSTWSLVLRSYYLPSS